MNKTLGIILAAVGCFAVFLFGCGGDKTNSRHEQINFNEKQYGFLTGDDVYLRELPSLAGKPITTMKKGTKVEILGGESAMSNKGFVVYDDNVVGVDLETKKEIKLNKGLALNLVKYENRAGIYELTLQSGTKKRVKINNVVAGGHLNFVYELKGTTWYNVKLSDGKEGYAYGDFIGFNLRECDKKLADKNQLHLTNLYEANKVIASKATIMGIPYSTDYDSGKKKLDEKWIGDNKMVSFYGPHYKRIIEDFGFEMIRLDLTNRQRLGYIIQGNDSLRLVKYFYALERQVENIYGKPIRKAGVYNVYKFENGVVALACWPFPYKPKHISLGIFTNQGYENGRSDAKGQIDWYKAQNKPFNEEEVVFNQLLTLPAF